MLNWQKETVLYQIYPKSFFDTNGDGIGDIPGIISKIPYLKSLGVNAVWLSPCFPSPNDDNGYDISDYRGIAPEYGTLDDFRELLDALHRNGIRLLLDLVVNHTSDEHPWFEASRKSRDNPYRDYYIWRDPVNGREPNDRRSAFGGSAWEFDERTGQYYFHLFSRKQPDLNWDHPAVRREIIDMINGWLDMGVDGFRCDVINSISKDPDFADLSVGPHLHEYLHELHEKAFGPHGAITIGETWGMTPEEALSLTADRRGELTAAFQFEHLLLAYKDGNRFFRCDPDRKAFVDILAKWEYGLSDEGYPVLVLENHDQPRAVSLFGDGRFPYESATMLAVLVYGMRGIAVIFQGQELGLENPVFRRLTDFRDIETINACREMEKDFDEAELLGMMNGGSRDNARVPMPWNGEKHGGFTTGIPWITAECDAGRTVAAEEAGERTVLKFYRRLFALRQSDPVLLHGDFELLFNDGGTVLYRREKDSERRFVVVRCADTPAPLPEELPAGTVCLLGNYEDAADTLRPYEARIYAGG